MVTVISVILLIVAALSSVWYTIRSTGRSQAAVEVSEAARKQAEARNVELEKTVADQAKQAKDRDEADVTKITTATDAIRWLQDSIAASKRPE